MDTTSTQRTLIDRVREHLGPTSDRYRHPLTVFPYTWRSLAQFVGIYAVLATTWTLLGLAAVHWLEPSALGRREVELSEWFAARRTDGLDRLAHIGSIPSDTITVLGLMAVLVIVFPLAVRRWHGWAFLVGALAMEVAVYQTSNVIVARPRPPVEQLEEVINFSFPSGHMAAAVTFYVGMLIVMTWHSVGRAVRLIAGIVALLAPLIVATSRLYLGVHYVSDLVAGALLGLVSVAAALAVARRGLADTVVGSDEIEPPHTTRLDLTEVEPPADRSV